MSITEKDAKFRFCPLLVTADGKMRFCQASQCMMWRWSGEGRGEGAEGFCGLAGAPLAASRAGRLDGPAVSEPRKEPENPFG